MILESIKYIRQEGKAKEWAVEDRDSNPIHLQRLNLIVGKNAVGKTRTLNLIRDLAQILSLRKEVENLHFKDNIFELVFNNKGVRYDYFLEVKDNEIIEEIISLDGECKLKRSENKIYSEQTKAFDALVLDSTIPATSKFNEVVYPFLKDLFLWGSYTHKINFVNQIGRKTFSKDLKSWCSLPDNSEIVTPREVIGILCIAKQMFGEVFDKHLIEDMRSLDYHITAVDIREEKRGFGIYVKEEELKDVTDQDEMSHGMFHALSFLIQLNYAMLSESSVCMLIDDMGEGLDYLRSKAMIDLLKEKVKDTEVQFVMASNDRYIMNTVQLDHFVILERRPHRTVFYNYSNSKENFDDFKYTGLSNFDFLTTRFYDGGFDEKQDE